MIDWQETAKWGDKFFRYVPAQQASDDAELWDAVWWFKEVHPECSVSAMALHWEFVKRMKPQGG